MEQYQADFIDFMIDAGVLTFGEFVTKSGRTEHVETAFPRHDPAEWRDPTPRSLPYSRTQIRALSPTHDAFLEVRSDRDLAGASPPRCAGERRRRDRSRRAESAGRGAAAGPPR